MEELIPDQTPIKSRADIDSPQVYAELAGEFQRLTSAGKARLLAIPIKEQGLLACDLFGTPRMQHSCSVRACQPLIGHLQSP